LTLKYGGHKIDHKNDHWGSIGAWAFSQIVHDKAIELNRRGERTLNVDSITVASFDQYMKSNLEAEDWVKEGKEYKGLEWSRGRSLMACP
jgi:hypothetical protein